MSKRQQNTAVRVANVPQADFDEQVESESPSTVTQLAKQGTKPRSRPPEPKRREARCKVERCKPALSQTPFQWYGGKWEIADWLASLLPRAQTFVLPFGGAGSPLWHVQPYPVEVLNDADEDLVYFFRCCRERGAELAAALELTPYARREFEIGQERSDDPLERARRFAVVARMSYGGAWGRSWSRAIDHSRKGMSSSVSRFLHLPETIRELHSRLRGVQVECLDALKLIARYDLPGTLFYCDPPYVQTERNGSNVYRHEYAQDDHRALLKTLSACRGKVAISGYDSDLYRKHLNGWRRVKRVVSCRSNVTSSGKVAASSKRVEVVWMNYQGGREMMPLISQNRSAPASPAQVVALDIETCNIGGDALEEVICALMADWQPPANIKDPEKIEARRQEAIAKLTERSALLDAARIGCVAVRTDQVGVVFNGLDRKRHKVADNEVISSGDERQMLVDLRTWLNNTTVCDTLLIGHNLLAFDLPRLRSRFVAHRLKLPNRLAPRLIGDQQPVADTMRLYCRFFTVEHPDGFVGLREVTERLFGMKYKNIIDGRNVPDLIEAGRVGEVLTYVALDTAATLAAYLLLTGNAPGMA